MKRAIFVTVVTIVLAGSAASSVQFGPVFLGAHFIPAVEADEGGRHWDVSLSFGLGLTLDEANAFEVHVLTDSQLTSLGLTVLYQGTISQRISAGAGLTVLWPFDEEQRLMHPLIEGFGHAVARYQMGPILRGELSLTFPLLTAAHVSDKWEIIPLAELPSLSGAAEFDFAEDAVLQGQLTFQPVITDTTELQRPIGRLSDNLLVLPLASVVVRYMP